MKVLTLVPSQKGHSPGQRGSIEIWERILAPAGVELHFVPFETEKLQGILYKEGHHFAKSVETVRGYFNRLGLLKDLDRFDAVFVYREAALLGPAFLEKRIARQKPIIYQLDDPLFVPYRSPSNGYLSYLKFFGKIKEIIRISSVVMVNSSQIREYAEDFNDNVVQVPSVVDDEKFTFYSDLLPNEPVIGWSGSKTTVKNLRMVEGPLQKISKNKIAELQFVGADTMPLQGVDYQAREWNAETEVQDLRRMNVGLVPLPDAPWNPYKFIMKSAQYMSLGIVPVGTPMASNPEVITHGETGFLADNDDEWFEYLSLLAGDEELRREMSAKAAARAKDHYSLTANADKVISAFRSALN